MDLLTWLASGVCAIGMITTALSSYGAEKSSFMVTHPLFLPLYYAGIIQWVLHGLRTENAALIYPSLIQLLALSVPLYKWAQRRLSL